VAWHRALCCKLIMSITCVGLTTNVGRTVRIPCRAMASMCAAVQLVGNACPLLEHTACIAAIAASIDDAAYCWASAVTHICSSSGVIGNGIRARDRANRIRLDVQNIVNRCHHRRYFRRVDGSRARERAACDAAIS
jgi:hypothetical protein